MYLKKFRQRNFVWQVDDAGAAHANPAQIITPAATDDASGDAHGAQPQPHANEKRFTQAELEQAIKARLEREREKAEAEAQKAASAAEAKRLQENQQFRELSEKQAADLLTLAAAQEALTGQLGERDATLARYEEVFAKQLAEQKKALPEPVVELLDKMAMLDQAAWLAANAAKLGGTTRGVPPSPRGTAGNGNHQEEATARQAAERRYSNF